MPLMPAVRSSGGLDTHLTQFTRLDIGENTLKFGDKRSKEVDLVASGDQDDNGNVPPADRLLVLDALVDGEQDVELRLGQREQFAVLLAGPSHFGSGTDLVASKLASQSLRHAFVKQQSHVG